MELSTENMHQGIAYTLHTVNGGGARVFVRILFSFHETDSGTSTMFSRTKNVVFTKFEFLERRVLASNQTSCVLYPDKNRISYNVSHFTKQKKSFRWKAQRRGPEDTPGRHDKNVLSSHSMEKQNGPPLKMVWYFLAIKWSRVWSSFPPVKAPLLAIFCLCCTRLISFQSQKVLVSQSLPQHTQKKNKDRREDKGRCGCLVNSLPRQLCILHQDEFIPFFISSWCNTSYSTNRPVQNSQRGIELNRFCPPSSSDDLCFLFCLHPSSLLARYSRCACWCISLRAPVSSNSTCLTLICGRVHCVLPNTMSQDLGGKPPSFDILQKLLSLCYTPVCSEQRTACFSLRSMRFQLAGIRTLLHIYMIPCVLSGLHFEGPQSLV